MAIVPQKTFFQYMQIEELGDLSRLVPAIENIPDKNLMEILEGERGHGRDDYPVRPCGTQYSQELSSSIPPMQV